MKTDTYSAKWVWHSSPPPQHHLLPHTCSCLHLHSKKISIVHCHNKGKLQRVLCYVIIMFSYHCAINGQRAVVQLTYSVADLDVYSIFAPLDGGQRVTADLTVQDGITTERFNPIGMKIPINNRRLCDRKRNTHSNLSWHYVWA